MSLARVRIHRHPDCERCARIARMHHRLDWLGRIEDTTRSPEGRAPVRRGEIVVRDLRTGTLHEGLAGGRLIFRHVPAYWPLLVLSFIAPLGRRMDADLRGCATDACER